MDGEKNDQLNQAPQANHQPPPDKGVGSAVTSTTKVADTGNMAKDHRDTLVHGAQTNFQVWSDSSETPVALRSHTHKDPQMVAIKGQFDAVTGQVRIDYTKTRPDWNSTHYQAHLQLVPSLPKNSQTRKRSAAQEHDEELNSDVAPLRQKLNTLEEDEAAHLADFSTSGRDGDSSRAHSTPQLWKVPAFGLGFGFGFGLIIRDLEGFWLIDLDCEDNSLVSLIREGPTVLSELGHVIDEITVVLGSLQSVSCCHIFKNCNAPARGALAKGEPQVNGSPSADSSSCSDVSDTASEPPTSPRRVVDGIPAPISPVSEIWVDLAEPVRNLGEMVVGESTEFSNSQYEQGEPSNWTVKVQEDERLDSLPSNADSDNEEGWVSLPKVGTEVGDEPVSPLLCAPIAMVVPSGVLTVLEKPVPEPSQWVKSRHKGN
ncbi:hypothetical protein FCV25MIE_12503 [Fagus crenata]